MLKNIKLEKANKRVSEERILDFFDKTSLKIPEDYLQFLFDYNGMYLKDYHCFYIPDIRHGAMLQVMYGFDLDYKGDSLDSNYYYNHNYNIPPEYIMIGHCHGGGGLFIMLSTDEETSGVYACDLFYDDFVFEESTEDNNVYKLADTFTEFMDSLKYVDITAKNEAYFPQHDFTFIINDNT